MKRISEMNVIEMMRGRRQARAAGIEELARRLAKGEAIAPEEIEAVLDRTGASEEQLQERIDALSRRAVLLAEVSAGRKAEARLDKIDGEITKAFDVVVDAQSKHRAVVAKHADERAELQRRVDRAAQAHGDLLADENLAPADRDRLAEARRVESEASKALSEQRRRMPELRNVLDEGERWLADAKATPGAIEARERAENAVKARKARLSEAEAELPRLQAAVDAAAKATAALEDELRR